MGRPELLILLVLVGVYVAHATDLQIVKTRTIDGLVAGVGASDATKANQYASTLSSTGTWSDVNYIAGCSAPTGVWPAATHVTRIIQMAKAWQAPTSSLHLNAALEAKIFLALSYWFSKDYTNENCTHIAGPTANCPCTTPGFWICSWWWNEIGLPLDMGQACILMSTSASFATKALKGCTHVLNRGNFNNGMSGANALWQAQVIVYNALINNDAVKLNATYRRAQQEIVFTAGSADGIKSDGQFLQHGGMVYTGGYGTAFQETVVDLMLPAAGTAYAMSTTQQSIFSTLVLEGQRWTLLYPTNASTRAAFDINVVGRQPARGPNVYGTNALLRQKLLNLTSLWPRSAEFVQYTQMLTAAVTPVTGNRMFSSSDMMFHRRKGYTVGLRGYSVRTLNSECVGNENIKGLHLGDGGTYVSLHSSNYYNVPSAWDWDHIPGITVDYRATPLTCAQTKITTRTTTFVGGYSDGNYGIFAMDFKGAFASTLTYHKSWFFFENEFVVLVSNITTLNKTQPVHHVFDSRARTGLTTSLSYGTTTQSTVSYGTGSNYAWWMHHDSIGYVIPANHVNATTAGRHPLNWVVNNVTSSWSVTAPGYSTTPIYTSLWTAWLGSVAPVTSDSVAYIVSPQISQSSFASTRATQLLSVVRIIKNTPTLQAVYQSELRILGIVFWSSNVTFADTALDWNVTPDSACVLHITSKKNSTVVQFGLADPAQKLAKVLVRVKKIVSCSGCTVSGNVTTIPFTLAAGRNFAQVNVTLSSLPPSARLDVSTTDTSSSSSSRSSHSAGVVVAIVLASVVVAVVLGVILVLVFVNYRKRSAVSVLSHQLLSNDDM